MNTLKLGLCSVTFRKKTAEEVISAAVKGGIKYIEWGGDVHVKNITDAKKVKELSNKAGIEISSYGSYFNCSSYDEEKWEEVCLIANELKAPSIRVWLGRKNSEDTSDEEYAGLLENTRKMCIIADKYSLLVCPECHDNTYNNNTDAFLRMKKDIGCDNFRTYFQSRYFRYDYDIDRIDRTFEHILNVHVSYRDLKREQRFRKKDRNYLDKLLKKLISKNFDGIVMIEFVSGERDRQFFKDAEKLRSY